MKQEAKVIKKAAALLCDSPLYAKMQPLGRAINLNYFERNVSRRSCISIYNSRKKERGLNVNYA